MAHSTINNIGVGDYLPFPDFQWLHGTAIVIGTAPGWQDEFNEAITNFSDATIYLVNGAGREAKGDYWVSLHPQQWFTTDGITRVSDRYFDCVDMAFPIATCGGTSSLLATLIALVMGHDRVITAGVHLLERGYKGGQSRWKWHEKKLAGRVKSASPEGTFIRNYFGGIYDI